MLQVPEPIQPAKEIVSVAEMSRMCGLSRSRFYQLMDDGILPKPSRNETTGRPFFDREKQESCLQVRRSNMDINGRAVMFYSAPVRSTVPPKTQRSKKRAKKKNPTIDPTISTLKTGLESLGIANVSTESVQRALADGYPDGYDKVTTADLITMVYRHLKRQNSPDNVS